MRASMNKKKASLELISVRARASARECRGMLVSPAISCSLSRSCFFLVGREGFEPSKAEPADLQSAPVDHFGTCPELFCLF